MKFFYQNKHAFLVIFILAIAAILRFYNFENIPYTVDEYSSLSRLNYENVDELIEKGVKVDGHPAGHQIFLYYYTKAFGQSKNAFKLVNIILGILSVLLVYLIGRSWYNRSAGVFAAVMMGSLQYIITHHQIGRMYGFGAFFVLLATLSMTYFIKRSDKIKYTPLIIYILAASICSYSHYFSFLSAGIIAATAFLITSGTKRKLVFISGIVVLLLFIPHIKITLYQLGVGGIEGWLGKFNISFFSIFFRYIYHWSWLVLVAVVLIIIFYIKGRTVFCERRYRWIALIWFLLPIVIGSVYSYYYANLMHQRVIFFAFPFLILFLASFIREVSVKRELVIVIILFSVNIYTLVVGRKHYELFYKNRYELVAKKSVEWEKEVLGDVINVLSTRPFVKNHFDKKYGALKGSVVYPYSMEMKEYVDIIKNDSSEYLIIGMADGLGYNYLHLAQHYFPNILKNEITFAGYIYMLSKHQQPIYESCITYEMDMLTNDNYKLQNIDSIQKDTSENIWYYIDKEYECTNEFALDEITFSKNNIIEISLNALQFDSLGGAMIVSQIEKDGKVYDWRSKSFDDFLSVGDTGFVTFCVFIPDIKYPKGSTLKCFIWDEKKAKYLVNDLNIKVYAGNPYLYSHIMDIPKDLSKYCIE